MVGPVLRPGPPTLPSALRLRSALNGPFVITQLVISPAQVSLKAPLPGESSTAFVILFSGNAVIDDESCYCTPKDH